VLIRRQNGDLETYTIPWIKTGTPVLVGPVPMPRPFDERLFATTLPTETDYMAELERARLREKSPS